MRALVLFGLALVVSATAVDVSVSYHDTIGIPTAAKIKAYEDAYFANRGKDEKIIGGVHAPVDAHPYFAGLLVSFIGQANRSVCGSSLISSNRLVTAAHCWRDSQKQAWQFEVILGSIFLYSGGIRINTNQVYTHPQWNPFNLNNDVAMIYLPVSVSNAPGIAPISLPQNNELWQTFVGQWATAVGFGKTSDQQTGSSTVVSHVGLQVMNVAQCQQIYNNPQQGLFYVVASTLCTAGWGGVGICGGDSGGPLVTNFNGRNILIGVSSFAAHNACQHGHPSAFARVTSFINFINQHM
ncbi:brachyurin-like [Trichoplusia ni]|uniref:Brachyurin-like n=1 Tax=Trichoplusia ni TaxID=7111 RepID=A0A7E5VPT5_TRINI|nr:brachyurin-like [Trichoplusia ni]